MTNYCLTDCFKQNLSKKVAVLVEILSALVAVALFIIFAIVILFTIGAITQFVTLYFGTNLFASNPIAVGLVTAIVALLIAVAGNLAVNFFIWLYKGTKNITTNLVLNVTKPEAAKCRIFEKCDK